MVGELNFNFEFNLPARVRNVWDYFIVNNKEQRALRRRRDRQGVCPCCGMTRTHEDSNRRKPITNLLAGVYQGRCLSCIFTFSTPFAVLLSMAGMTFEARTAEGQTTRIYFFNWCFLEMESIFRKQKFIAGGSSRK